MAMRHDHQMAVVIGIAVEDDVSERSLVDDQRITFASVSWSVRVWQKTHAVEGFSAVT